MTRTVIHTERRTIDRNIEEVWALASSFGAIQSWMPSIKSCVIDGHGVGSIRTLESMAGEVKERLEILNHDDYIISYHIMDTEHIPAKGSYGNWKLEADGDRTIITWTADAEEVSAEGIAALDPFFGKFMKDSLDGLEKALT